MKEINCTFQMGGTYYLKERSVLAARRRAMTDLPLPEDRDYINDSLVVDDLDECMVANGWSDEEVAYLSKLESSTLIKMIGQRIKDGVEVAPNEPFTTARLKMFLLDYYDIEYTPSQQNTPQPSQAQPNTTRPCFIVLYSCHEKGPNFCAFESETAAKESISKDVKSIDRELANLGHKPKIQVLENGSADIHVPGTSIYHNWELIKSTIKG